MKPTAKSLRKIQSPFSLSGRVAVPFADRQSLTMGLSVIVAATLVSAALGQTIQPQSIDETPQTRLRPIDAPSALDRYQKDRADPGSVGQRQHVAESERVVTAEWESSPSIAAERSREASDSRYTARMQFAFPQGGGPVATPPSTVPSTDGSVMSPPSLGGIPQGMAAPNNPTTLSPAPPGSMAPNMGGTVLGPSTAPMAPANPSIPFRGTNVAPLPSTVAPPRGLPMNGGSIATTPMPMAPAVSGTRDLLPVAAPQLNDEFATIDNCSCVSPPSGYVAETGWKQYAPKTAYTAAPVPYVAPAPTVATTPIAAPAVIPDASNMPKGSGVPNHSLVSFGQDRNPIVVGQGLVGQPVAYVPGQPFRNALRYIFP